MNIDPKPKMKLWKKILIGIIATLILLGIILIVTLIWKITWILFFVFIGISFLIWVIISTILIYQKIIKKQPEVIKADLEDLREYVKFKMKEDRDNPDNFRIDKQLPIKIGESGAEKTLIWAFIGKGMELGQERIVLVNEKNKNEIAILIEPTEKEMMDVAIRMAENQPTLTTREIIPGAVDEFGVQRNIVRITSQTKAEAKEEKEKQEAIEKSTF